MAQTGNGTNLFPPMNDGSANGVGMIDGHDGNKYIFQTPEGVRSASDGSGLDMSGVVYFDVLHGNTAHNVSHENPDVGGIPDDGGFGDPA